jgi:hypothetical protein
MAKSSIDIEELKQFIAKDESGGDYNIYNFGESGGGGIRSSKLGSGYYRSNAISLTNKTVRQVLTLQRSYKNPLGKGEIFAVGKYQTIPLTLYSIATKLNILDSLFDEVTQEKIGDYLILNSRSEVYRYVKGTNGGSKKDLEDAVQGLGQEFASFPIITRDGKSWGNVETGEGNKAYYGGSGPNPDKSKYTVKDVVKKLIQSRINYSEKNPSYTPSYFNGSKGSTSSNQNKISGKVTDDKGQPIAGVQIKLTPTGSSSSSTQGESDTPFKNSTESDEFRKWLLNKYPEYETKPKPYNVDPPPQPNSINTKALKKAWSEKGTEYNITNLKFTSYEEMPDGVIEPVTVVTDKDGNWEIKTPTTFDANNSTVTFSKEGHEIRSLNNIQQTGGEISISGQKEYNIPRLTLPSTPDATASATNKLNQDILTEETNLIKQQGNSELSAQEKIANTANKQKEELKKTIIPFIIKLLSQFGGVALQAIISKIPLEQIKNQIQCPTQAKLLELINKRNKLVKQVNNAYNTVTTLTKTIRIVDSALTAVQAGITAIEALPYPAIGVPPLGLPPLTSGIIEVTGSGKDKLKEALKKAKVVINIVTLALAAFGAILGIVLRLLNSLDGLIQQCAQEQDIPFETINTELNTFVNESTGISNSAVIQATQEDNTYRGFTLEIKLDSTNSSKYPRRFAQALNKIGIPVLKTDSSFASDPQVLLDQLKFIIDSNPQLTAE